MKFIDLYISFVNPQRGPGARMIVHPESSPCQGEIFHIICLARSDPVRVNFGLEIIKKNGWNQKLKIAPIWMKLCTPTTNFLKFFDEHGPEV